MKNKLTYILIGVLLLLFCLIGWCCFSINQKQKFVKPEFEKNARIGVPNVENIEEKVLKISDSYEFYVEPVPLIEGDSLVINLTSMEKNNVLLKLRLLDKEGHIIGETGLLKPGQYVEKLTLKENVNYTDEVSYIIMGYEMDSYLSAGTISLRVKINDEN